MKPFRALLVIVAIIIAPDHICSQEELLTAKQTITNISRARAEAFNEGNAEDIAKHFTEDAVLMVPGKPVFIGKKWVKAYYQSIFDKFEVQLESHYEEVEVMGDMAYGRGEAIVRATPKNGGEITVTSSKYLNILRRQPDGNWKTTHDIWNSNGEAP